mgnify:CR=1 FL=1
MDYQRLMTGNDMVVAVMKTMGLNPPASVPGSTDKTAIQMWALATEVGQNLMREAEWTIQTADFFQLTTIGLSEYDLPEDYDGFSNDASWNYGSRLPVIGTLTDTEWAMLKVRLQASSTFTQMYRIGPTDTSNGVSRIELLNAPTAVETLYFPYRSRGWVIRADNTRSDNLDAADDRIMLDSNLFRVALKKAWREEKGFDTTKLEKQYKDALAKAKAADQPGRTLSLSRRAEFPYLGYLNMPDTGYGI